jgi:hypothetical protein
MLNLDFYYHEATPFGKFASWLHRPHTERRSKLKIYESLNAKNQFIPFRVRVNKLIFDRQCILSPEVSLDPFSGC